MIFQDRMIAGINALVSNPNGDLGEATAKMQAQVMRIDPQISGACIPNTEVSA
ncbi:hypothetical protein ACQZ6F_03040 [Rhizobium sp. A22-96]